MSQHTARALDMLSVALEMEIKGKSFYEKAIAESKDALGKNIFTMLRDDEVIHVDRIKAIYSELQGQEKWSENWKASNPDHDNLVTMFQEIAKKNGPKVQANAEDLKALMIGIEFEATAISFYQKHLQSAADPIEKEFIEKMIIEERDHHKALSDMHHYLNNPESYFEEMDRIGLDGA